MLLLSVASPAQIAFPIQGIHPPSYLDVKENVPGHWKTLKQAWGNYAITINIHQQSETYQVALFLHSIGPEALKIFNGTSFDDAQDREKLENIITKFDELTIGETNETYERYGFNSRIQSPDGTFDAYVAWLRTLSQTCNFCERIRESLIRDRIVFGIQNPQTRKRLRARAAQRMKLLIIHGNNFNSVPASKRNKAVVHQLLTVQQVVTQYPKVFKSQLGHFPGVVKIEIDATVQPVVTPTRRIPTAPKEKFKKEVDRLQPL